MGHQPLSGTVVAKDIHGNTYDVSVDELRWRPSVYAILIQDGRVLVLPQYGKYDLPGGGVEYGEMLEASLVRETQEETGLLVGEPRLLQAASSFFKLPGDEDYIQSLMLYYVCEVKGGQLSRDGLDEGERSSVQLAEWLPLTKLDDISLTSSVDWRPFVRQAAGLLDTTAG